MSRHIPIHGKYLKLLRDDDLFQQRFTSDPELDALETERHNPAEELNELVTVLGGRYAVDGNDIFTFSPVTPGAIAVLWAVESPYISNKTPAPADVDAALYLLSEGQAAFTVSAKALYLDSFGFCRKAGLSAAAANSAVIAAITLAFRAFRMFPSTRIKEDDRPQVYDADWLTSVVAMVSAVTRLPPDEIIWRMPMTAAGYYICQYCRRNGVKHIEKRPDNEVSAAILERTFTLCRERLDELQITNYLTEPAS